jgi:hypothetical protein
MDSEIENELNCGQNKRQKTLNKVLTEKTSEQSFDNKYREKLIELIKGSDKSITYENCDSKKDFWKGFKKVFENNKLTEYAICNHCSKIIKYNSRIGTNSLSRHKCVNKEIVKNEETIDRHLIKRIKGSNIKSKIAESIVCFAAKDLRPFSVVEGKGFRILAQELLKIGSKHPNISVDDVIPSDTTVTNHLTDVYEKIKRQLIQELSNVPIFGITTDHWGYEKTKTTYNSITIQYISNGNTYSRVLGTIPTSDKRSSTIREDLEKVFKEFCIENSVKYYVTDNASAMKAAFNGDNHFGCSAHNINLIHVHAFKDIKSNNSLNEIKLLMKSAKQLVSYFNHSEKQKKLKTTLKQSIDIRWDSKYLMLDSIHKNYNDIRILALDDEKIMEKFIHIKESVLIDILNFLKPFYDLRITLCQDLKPTFHLVLPTKQKMLSICRPNEKDSNYMKSVKSIYLTKIEDYFKVSDHHFVGSLLYPPIKNLKLLATEEQKSKAIYLLEKLVNKYDIEIYSTSEDNIEILDKIDYCLKDFIVPNESTLHLPKTPEIEDYLLSSHEFSNDFSIMNFWDKNKQKYPRLHKVFIELSSIPATNTSSERNNSIAGLTLCDRRSRLDPLNVNKLLFIHSNFDLYN